MTPRLSAVLFFLFCVLSSAHAFAQGEGGRTCEYRIECPGNQFCNAAGRCVLTDSAAERLQETKSGEDECGNDRRCRIDRLKRRNRATRHAKVLKEERQVKYQLEQEQKRKLEERPRLKDPIAGALRVSILGPLGVFGGYTFAGRIQPSFELTYNPNRYVYAPSKDSTPELDGTFDGWWLRGGVQFFLMDGWFSPVVGAGMQVGLGRFDDFGSFGFDVVDSDGLQGIFHAAEATAGFDMQFGFGMWSRLSAAYRPLIWNQARYGPGSYDEATRDGLANWYRRSNAFDVVWMLGYAF